MLLKVFFPVVISLLFLIIYCDTDTIRITFALAAFFTAVSRVLAKLCSNKPLEGYPTWSYYSSMLQQAVILPPFAVLLVYQHRHELHDWLFCVGEYQGKHQALGDITKTLSLLTTGSAMIKDFWIYGNRNELGFIIHHITTVFACAHCMAMPIYPGAVCLTGIFAECTSFFYNLNVLSPSRTRKYLQTIFIGISNILAINLCRIMWTHVTDSVYLYWKVGFSLIVAVLVSLRFSGLIALFAQ